MVLDSATLDAPGLSDWEGRSVSPTWGDDAPPAWGLDAYERELHAMLADLSTGVRENQLFHRRVAEMMGRMLDLARAAGAPVVPLCQELVERTRRALALHAIATLPPILRAGVQAQLQR